MGKLRLRFSKTGRAKYISHLDLMATFRRALLRAGVKLRYTQGFNPHPVMSIALPLPVGCESVCELLDFQPEDELAPSDMLLQELNAAFPEGIEVFECYTPERKAGEIKWIEVAGSFIYNAGPPPRALERLRERYAEQSIVISKRTKSGVSDLDIVPHIRDVQFYDGDTITMTAKLSAQNPSVSPENFTAALTGELAPDFATYRRTEVFDAEMNVFR